ncbi:sulfatase [bacterium]|nr:sulfatase [bacterium]
MKAIINILFRVVAFSTICSALLANDRPNFVFFITDDISADDLGAYGSTVAKTPNLDRIAAEGLVFDKAYLTTSSCSPSRCSIITGRYPHNTGAPELHLPLPEDQVTFVQKLKDAGYYTVISGKNHMNDSDKIGFITGSDGGKPAGSEDWVKQLKDRPKDKPFFAWFGSYDAHRDWQMDEHSPAYDPDDIVVPPFMYDGPRTRQDLAEYFSEVSRTDHYTGKLIAELKSQGIAENTYFVYTADNGRPFPRSKSRLYDSGIKTPLIVWRPGTVKPGRSQSLVSVIDYAPTFLELAGLEKGPSFQGVSLAPLLKNPKTKVRDYTFSEHNWHVYAAHERMVRHGDWMLIRNSFNHKRALATESDDWHYPAAMELWDMYRTGKTHAWQEDIPKLPRPRLELFHVTADPHQMTNLAGSPEHKAIQRKLEAVLDQWAEETGDNIPDNPTPDRPKGPRRGTDVRGELPGEATGANKINNSGPILEG